MQQNGVFWGMKCYPNVLVGLSFSTRRGFAVAPTNWSENTRLPPYLATDDSLDSPYNGYPLHEYGRQGVFSTFLVLK